MIIVFYWVFLKLNVPSNVHIHALAFWTVRIGRIRATSKLFSTLIADHFDLFCGLVLRSGGLCSRYNRLNLRCQTGNLDALWHLGLALFVTVSNEVVGSRCTLFRTCITMEMPTFGTTITSRHFVAATLLTTRCF